MKIQRAIEFLQEMQKGGVQNIILAYWEASFFHREDDKSWEEDAKMVEDTFDWSSAHEQIDLYIESQKEVV